MGQDKRRKVIGHAHGPSRRSQILFFGAVVAATILVVGGYYLAVALFDQPADSYPDRAPWASPDAPRNASGASSPRSPAGPCGEPGSPQPAPAGSPCARGESSGDEASGSRLRPG